MGSPLGWQKGELSWPGSKTGHVKVQTLTFVSSNFKASARLNLLSRLLKVSVGEEWSPFSHLARWQCTRLTLPANCSALDDRDVHLVTRFVSDLWGNGTREKGKCHVAEWVLHSARSLTDVCFPGPRAVYHPWTCSVKQFIPPATPMGPWSQQKASAPFSELCARQLRPVLWD